jgi:F0F1-type ATP synthase membrane subunit c/vacuolar-type H+-ATPase subunit K
MLVGFAEGLGAAKTYATRDHYEVDANRELLGLGAANVASGLASGMVVNGSLSKTAVNGSAGARSQISGLVCAALTVVTLLLLTSLFEDLPEATLAAVVSAARMLFELAADLERDGVALVIARDVGQVRDVLRASGSDGPMVPTYPTVHEAVEAVRRHHPERVMSAHPRDA